MLLEIDVGLVALADVVGAEVAVGAGGGLDLADELLQRRVDVAPEGVALGHGAVERVEVHPVAVVDGVAVDGAVGVVPADGGGAPAGLLGVARRRSAAPVMGCQPCCAGVVDAEAVVEA